MNLQPATDLATRAAHVLQVGARRPFAPSTELLCGADLIRELTFEGATEPQSQPIVDRYLNSHQVNDAGAAAMLAALRAASPLMSWNDIHDGYGGEPGMEHFCDNFSFAALAAPPRWAGGVAVASKSVGLTFTLQGPDVYYPDHAHKAVEIYYVIAGQGEWQKDSGDFVAYGPGSLIEMPSFTPHALSTGVTPVLILYAWIGDIGGEYRIL